MASVSPAPAARAAYERDSTAGFHPPPPDQFRLAELTIGFVIGPICDLTEALWIGLLLAASVGSLALSVTAELNRAAPLLDIRWRACPDMLHLTDTLFLFRLVRSAERAGAHLGVPPAQLIWLFGVFTETSLPGELACVAWMRLKGVGFLHWWVVAVSRRTGTPLSSVLHDCLHFDPVAAQRSGDRCCSRH